MTKRLFEGLHLQLNGYKSWMLAIGRDYLRNKIGKQQAWNKIAWKTKHETTTINHMKQQTCKQQTSNMYLQT